MSISSFVESSLRVLQREQLITGEIAGYTSDQQGVSCYFPCPLWSAVTYDALSFLDAGSNVFETSVVDLFSPAKYRVISATVCTLRWRLRTYLAWEEEADGTWRKAGRNSSSLPDPSTTACAALALSSPGSTRDRGTYRRLSVLDRWFSAGPSDGVARAQMLRLLSALGAETRELSAAVWDDCRNESQDTMFWYSVGRAWNGARLPGQTEMAELIVPRILNSKLSAAMFDDRSEMALHFSSLLDLGYTGPLLAEMFRRTVTAPIHGEAEFGLKNKIRCPGATIALAVSNVTRASMRIAGQRLE